MAAARPATPKPQPSHFSFPTLSIFTDLRNLLGEVADFVRRDFKWSVYAYALGIIVLFDFLEIRWAVFSGFIFTGFGPEGKWLAAPLLYLVLYFVMMVPVVVMQGEAWRLRHWQAWALPAALVCLQGMSQYAGYYLTWFEGFGLRQVEEYFVGRTSVHLMRGLTVLLGICFFRLLTERRFALFGLPRNGRYLRLYLGAFLVMFPFLVYFASTEDFMRYYPVFKFWDAAGAFGLDNWQLAAIFDFGYSIDYLSTECIFRGALIIGLVRWLGPRCVLPMILVYVGIHAGKPYVEMCSAAVGGYLLGVLAYCTRHLWGGIFAHVAIAISMECLASAWHLL